MRRLERLTALCAALLLVATPALARLPQLRGKVVGVTDGDTITLLVEGPKGKRAVKVRLHGIDCPEKA